MKIGIATCADKPGLTVGDREVASLLEKKGIQTAPLIWNENDLLSENWDAIIIRSTWDYHQHWNQFLNWLSQIERSSIQLINSPEIVRWNLDKSYLLDMERRGVSIVPSLVLKRDLSESQVLDKIRKTGWTNLILKPTISATAYLTFSLTSASVELPEVISKLQKHSDLIVQPFVSSIVDNGEASLIFFKDQSLRYSHSVLKKPQSKDFRVQSDFGGTVEILKPSKQLLNYATSCAEAIQGEWVFARVESSTGNRILF